MRVLNRVSVPGWWALYGAFISPLFSSGGLNHWPPLALFLLPVCGGIWISQFVACFADRRFFQHNWDAWNILRLSVLGTVSLIVPLCFLALGFDTLHNRNAGGVLWLLSAGPISLVGTISLRAAQGFKTRSVKSGELYKRAFVIAKRMGVRLRQVSVVPFGRGRLTNAFGGFGTISITDDYGHWSRGAELDFVVAHELAHVKRRHAIKKLAFVMVVWLVPGILTSIFPHVNVSVSVLFKFSAILIPLLAFYFMSRRAEFEADQISVSVTGDKAAAVKALESLCRRSGNGSGTFVDELFSTHPSFESRIAAIAKQRLRVEGVIK
jgi:Zn-dependent protease with chaperone function